MVADDNEPKGTDPAAAEPKEDKAARMNSAKAFYRAMYAGAEPDPDEFGIDLGGKERGGDGASAAELARKDNEIKEADAKAAEWENLYKRMQADFDNYRKRMDRERDDMQSIGMQKALEAILPALDDLDMAQSKLTENTESKVMLQSFKMICSRFNRCLEMVGIKQMSVIGEPFDPRLHEPIQEVHTAEFPEGAVVQQLRPGYIFGEKVLRPTLVNVATAPLDGPGYQPPVAGESAPKSVEVSEADVLAAVKEPDAVEHSQTETSDVLPVIDLQEQVATPEPEKAVGEATSDTIDQSQES